MSLKQGSHPPSYMDVLRKCFRFTMSLWKALFQDIYVEYPFSQMSPGISPAYECMYNIRLHSFFGSAIIKRGIILQCFYVPTSLVQDPTIKVVFIWLSRASSCSSTKPWFNTERHNAGYSDYKSRKLEIIFHWYFIKNKTQCNLAHHRSENHTFDLFWKTSNFNRCCQLHKFSPICSVHVEMPSVKQEFFSLCNPYDWMKVQKQKITHPL